MIDRIIRFSVQNKLVIVLLVMGLIGWGSYSLSNLPIDALPDITNNQVQVITIAPTLASQEVEQYVTAPVEAACASLPDMIELRSISRLGLSVITIVFKDHVDIYKARQMIGERLKEAEGNIPAGVGKPEMAPVSTGLGEIYQYVIHAKPGYDSVYSDMDLRTFQDWIVKRQLARVPGVAEVNTLGGHLKQYEIAVDAQKLRAMNITIPEIYDALEKNNENTGASYIEKGDNSFFIRGMGMVKELADIENIVIKETESIPVLVGNVADVRYGFANRYGAATRDGKGEVVVGIVMMLKGQNSAEVTSRVKEKIETIQKSLPEGVVIQPFLDRSHLVERTINTVTTNLVEGGLIVVFILVLFLGNLRAGLVVASVIPLSMLFAIGMMYAFGVSGNLMSLGAIDFGLIVDGAVIIVESIVHRTALTLRGGRRLTQPEMDEEVYHASSKIRTSAAFGEIIILIVYLPILTLSGIEGKMFLPMAQTVSFAILGAFILSLTYVPMMSALFLSKKAAHRRNISDRLMDLFQRLYSPLIHFAIKRKMAVVITSVLLFLASLLVFTRIGGEFIPTLEEGDLAINTRVMAGTSLSRNIEIVTDLERMLKAKFPEVKQVVSRIGAAEIPTDPMSVEVADMIVVLKDKKEWTSASSRDELADKIKKELSDLPGVSMEISQPVQLRFNELMTGVRSDVAVKIFGDDIELLSRKASEAIRLIENINGIADLKAEQITGLPQITVNYNRQKISQYGLSIYDINRVLRTAFAGEAAGVVFEGEKRFDMVVRLEKGLRTDIDDVRNLSVPLPDGKQVPMYQLAGIEYNEGPMQISRDDGRRRVVLGLNVRNRDVQSVVKEIQSKLEKELQLPAGYYVTYGGQFENLTEANKRLALAVPVALLLILLLLYFTFHSFRQTLLIFTAVPLSAIGGVLALWARGMPFSISAGVGFIALFGVAVLNGIVLIAYFNQLKKEGMNNIQERVLTGTRVRLRPVLMTAAVASLGFLPMALSTSAGAEVQKPLATVVIGGLVSATILTLVVLPVFYIMFSEKKKRGTARTAVTALFLLSASSAFCQTNQDTWKPLSVQEAIDSALKNNPRVKSSGLAVEEQNALRKTAFELPKTNVMLLKGQYNSAYDDNNFLISQEISFPTVYVKQGKVQKQNVLLSEQNLLVTRNELTRDVKAAYYQLVYINELLALLSHQDSVYKNFAVTAELRYKTGESTYLEMISAQNKYQEVLLQKKQSEADAYIYKQELQKLLNTSQPVEPTENRLQKLPLSLISDTAALNQNPMLAWYNQRINVADAEISLQKNKRLPDLTFGYFNQSLDRVNGFQGFQVGVGIPIFSWGQKGRIQSSRIRAQIAQNDYEQARNDLKTTFNQELEKYQKYSLMVGYYETTGIGQAEEILRMANLAYTKGEMGYMDYIHNLTQAIGIKMQYYYYLNELNQSVININYLTGGK